MYTQASTYGNPVLFFVKPLQKEESASDFLSNGYTFGFNGKEKNTEVSEGNYDFGARIYDARIGRFLSVDPLAKKYASWSTYTGLNDNPISLVDPTGMGAEITKITQNGIITSLSVNVTMYVYTSDPAINVANQATILQNLYNNQLNAANVTMPNGDNPIPVTFNVTVIPTTLNQARSTLAGETTKTQRRSDNYVSLNVGNGSGQVTNTNGGTYNNFLTLDVSSRVGIERVMSNILQIDANKTDANGNVILNNDGNFTRQEYQNIGTIKTLYNGSANSILDAAFAPPMDANSCSDYSTNSVQNNTTTGPIGDYTQNATPIQIR